jgi:hypothetical protein
MKQIHKQKLQEEFIKYAKQIGIIDNELPYLTFDPNEYIKRLEDHNDEEATDSRKRRIKSSSLGRCHTQSKTLFVNQNSRGHTWEYDRNNNGKKIKVRRHGEIYTRKTKHKINYNIFKRVLIHELVHYRFPKMPHGDRFEKRIMEILQGKVFPEVVLYPNDTTQADNKNISINYENLKQTVLSMFL